VISSRREGKCLINALTVDADCDFAAAAVIVSVPESAWMARQYRGKPTIRYVSVQNGTDTNLPRG
jgi:hypothetical protein